MAAPMPRAAPVTTATRCSVVDMVVLLALGFVPGYGPYPRRPTPPSMSDRLVSSADETLEALAPGVNGPPGAPAHRG
ncbi:dihydroneopterin aldolase [Streptomyces laurentii]|uniref:Dihydroneopterin aldolase n=1 Tax=Streptomyces laurentii TaxID=39478 RepID=A0A160NTF2_STRLU|nr:dihydroneopterin aldolase [Streptomyces laurentii]